MIYFTSDLHFGHRNVMNYCNRPFSSLEEMHQYIIETWNNTVTSEDTVYMLGDFSLNPKWSDQIVPLLNGTKILIPGNHDACFPWREGQKHTTRYYKAGWKEIHKELIITLSNGQSVLLSHLPYPTSVVYDDRYMSYRPDDVGLVLVHGHLHGKYIKYKNMIDVGMDAHEMKMVSEDKLIELINDPREFIPSSITEFYKTRVDNRD